MKIVFEPPLNNYLAAFLLAIAIVFFFLSIKRFLKTYLLPADYTGSRWLIRGIRCLLLALTAGVWAAGFFWAKGWLLIIGLVIIGQELFEGVMISSALRKGEKLEKKD